MSSTSPTVVGRLAPSPTGRLHLGHARSFLLAWWSARAAGGRVLLRIEDLDQERAREQWTAAIVEDLTWLGLDWDGAVELQSEHLDTVDLALEQLVGAGRVYPCVCTRREVREAASAPHDEVPGQASIEPVYPGTCRGRFGTRAEAEAITGRQAVLRFLVEGAAGTARSQASIAGSTGPVGATAVDFHDELQGPQSIDLALHGGDFVVSRKGGLPAYQLAVVEADARAGVTEVLRGDDLLVSTARQLLLQRALGLPSPRWLHVPLVQDPEGERLAKRTGGLSLAELREAGLEPERVVAWVAASAGMSPGRRGTAAERIGDFDVDRLPREPVRLDPRAFG
ncbi:MAG: tRNA glutamyl-Q(34) synthetase GluQRS [Planctomycetota bacterium]|nr:tRNA glutamyl-Q(34) synthetase GluQRS [Planctomycetota bacterium]